MAQKRVIAHFMDEAERELVLANLRNIKITESFAVGDIEEEVLKNLAADGIVFQHVNDGPRMAEGETKALDRMVGEGDQPQEPIIRGSISPKLKMVGLLASLTGNAPEPTTGDPTDKYYLTLDGPLLTEWRSELETNGVVFREAHASYCWLVQIAPTHIAAVGKLSFVQKLEMRTTDQNMPKAQALGGQSLMADGAPQPVLYDVRLDSGTDLPTFLAWLAQRNIRVEAAEGRKVRLALPVDDPRLQEISKYPAVSVRLEPYSLPVLHNDRSRALVGVEDPAGVAFPYTGQGELIGVADTGLDEQHPDFAGQVAAVVSLGRPGDVSDPNGHGTHVSGTILGSGAASGGSYRGIAPGARLYLQSLLDFDGELGGVPLGLQTLFEQAYAAGVRIHNNSWGTAALSAYRFHSLEVDEFAHAHKDMLLVFSAGNEGTAADPVEGTRNAAPGSVNWLTMGAPATAKNALTVGASRSDRTSGGRSALTYGSLWEGRFTGPPMLNDTVSGDPEGVAAFSSRGPCDDYRIKPDVVAPGTDILSCKSAAAPLYNFWGPYPPAANHYAYWGGTSMAAPLVTGCAALVRQYYRQVVGHQPSAALLKATLINSTRFLNSPSGAPADCPNQPNYHQGFGRVNMLQAVPNSLMPGLALEFYDNWAQPDTHFAELGRSCRFWVTLPAAGELRITMAYTDMPGNGLQNNLNLIVKQPNGKKVLGNADLPMSLGGLDARNNVEVVRLAATAGAYYVEVVASNLLGPQDFALVLTFSSSFTLTQV